MLRLGIARSRDPVETHERVQTILTDWGWLMAPASTILVVSQSLLVNLNHCAECTRFLVLLTETSKLLICFVLLIMYTDMNLKSILRDFQNWRDLRLYALPGLVYVIQNNIVLIALAKVPAPTYLMLLNLKIPMTALLYVFALKRALNGIEWAAILLLLLGVISSQLDPCNADWSSEITSDSIFGFFLVFLICVASSFASVYTEYLMKRNLNEPIFLQNMKLYLFGIFFELLALPFYNDDRESETFSHYLSFTGLLTLMNQTAMGLVVSVVIKHANVMVNVFANGVAMILTTLLSMLVMSFHPTLQLFVGIATVTISLFLYNYERQRTRLDDHAYMV